LPAAGKTAKAANFFRVCPLRRGNGWLRFSGRGVHSLRAPVFDGFLAHSLLDRLTYLMKESSVMPKSPVAWREKPARGEGLGFQAGVSRIAPLHHVDERHGCASIHRVRIVS
jgi:hypothetical protein